MHEARRSCRWLSIHARLALTKAVRPAILAVLLEATNAAASPPASIVDMCGGAGISLGLLSDGTAWDWGWAYYGCLGDGNTNVTIFDLNSPYDKLHPVQPLGPTGSGVLTGIVAIAGSERHQVALDAAGNVWTWGWNIFGQLGNGTTPASLDFHYTGPYSMGAIPATNGLTSVKAIGTRGYHSLALKTNGEVWAWGYNLYGQCGDGTGGSGDNRYSPVLVGGLTGHGSPINVAGGGFVSAALMADHSLMMWGRNNMGQLGSGTTDVSDVGQWTPVAVSQATGLTNIQAVALSFSHAAALAPDSTVWTWGDNSYGALGNGTIGGYTNMPFHVPGLTNVVQVSAGDGTTTALKSDGSVWSWGWNANGGGVGDGTTNQYYSPVHVAAGHTFSFARTMNWTTYAVQTDGTAWSWGANFEGQLGDGTNADALAPVRISWPVIRPSSSGYGGVSPSGSEVVGYGLTNTVTLTASNWYHLASLLVDGTNAGVAATYTFSNVTTDHTLAATFAADLAASNTPKWWLAQANPAWTNNFDSAATNDADGDGSYTWQEYIAGTDPTNAGSSFRISIALSNGMPVVSFPTIAPTPQYEATKRYYSVESITNTLPSPDWKGVQGWTNITGLGQTVAYTNQASGTNLTFRGTVILGP